MSKDSKVVVDCPRAEINPLKMITDFVQASTKPQIASNIYLVVDTTPPS